VYLNIYYKATIIITFFVHVVFHLLCDYMWVFFIVCLDVIVLSVSLV